MATKRSGQQAKPKTAARDGRAQPAPSPTRSVALAAPDEASGFAALEALIEKAVGELERLRGENHELRQRLGDLEDELTNLGDTPAAWTEEREQLRGRVERLARRLEELLEQVER